jgi:hypothetical protein
MNPARSPERPAAPVLIALVTAGILLVAACGGSAATTAPTSAATPTAVTSTAPVVTTPPVTAPSVTDPPASTAPGIGVKIRVGDVQFVTAQAAERWHGTTTIKPGSGMIFETVAIRIDAITLTSFASADFKVRDAAGHLYAYRITGRAPDLYFENGLEPGHFYNGWVTYEIPTGLGQLTLVYKPSFLAGSTFEIPLR